MITDFTASNHFWLDNIHFCSSLLEYGTDVFHTAVTGSCVYVAISPCQEVAHSDSAVQLTVPGYITIHFHYPPQGWTHSSLWADIRNLELWNCADCCCFKRPPDGVTSPPSGESASLCRLLLVISWEWREHTSRHYRQQGSHVTQFAAIFCVVANSIWSGLPAG